MDLRVKLVPLAKIKPNPRNPRTHSPEQVAQIAASITEWGWTVPLLVDEQNEIIAGHGRFLAAQALGLKTVPTIMTAGWTEAQRRAYVIADNKLAMNSAWDMDLLKLEVDDIATADFDMDLLGFTGNELQALQGEKVGLTDPDAVPELPEKPIAKAGDVWLLGKHRLVCGDATDAATVEHCLNGVEPNLMVTDPPYGVNYDANWRNEADRANGKPYGARAIGQVNNDDRVNWGKAWGLFPGSVAYVWHADRHASEVQCGLEAEGFEIRCQIIWAKTRFAISRGDYHWQHEPCWYAVRKGNKGGWTGDRKQTTLWTIDHQKSETGHSAQKPVQCMLRPIENNSNAGQAVYDPFVGSGTTIIAAEITGRICYAIEIHPAYIDVAVNRWQDFTGETATRENLHGTKSKANAPKNRHRQPREKAAQQA